MQRAASIGLGLAVVVIVGLLAMSYDVPSVSAATQDCSWGQLKCCYADPPCGSGCCPPKRPKDEEVQDGGSAAIQLIKDSAFWTFLNARFAA